MTNSYKTDNHQQLTRRLGDALIAKLKISAGGDVADRLEKLREVVWPEVPPNFDSARAKAEYAVTRRKVFEEVLQDLAPEQRTKLLDAYARLGHINEIAGQAARHEYFDKLRTNGTPIPGGVKEFVINEAHKGTNVLQLVDKIAQPVFEVVMTMHPTNTNSLEFMKAQRQLSNALELGDDQAVDSALDAFITAPILNQKNGKDSNFTVRDESAVVLNYLGNIYEDLPKIYGHFDRTLGDEYGTNYNPLDLKLNMRFASWGSAGDKDGNNNVTAETTLEAIAMHTQAIVSRYQKDLSAMDISSSPELQQWKTKIDNAAERLEHIVNGVGELRKTVSEYRKKPFDPLLPTAEENYQLPPTIKSSRPTAELVAMYVPKKQALFKDKQQKAAAEYEVKNNARHASDVFDIYVLELAQLRKSLNQRSDDKPKAPLDFEKAVAAHAQSLPADSEERKKAIDLLRRVRTFGFSFGKIEYRETAEEYSRVVGLILAGRNKSIDNAGDYTHMTPHQRLALLTEIMAADEHQPALMLKRELDNIIEGGACNPYEGDHKGSKFSRHFVSAAKEILPIAYHTLKRMELAREFPDMITDNVLAECGRMEGGGNHKDSVAAQGAVNILEAKFIQLMAEKDGKAPILGIVPLFEEPETMRNIDHIMAAAYHNKVYHRHLEKLSEQRGEPVTQQVQIAHSDNARRSGLLAARAYIHEAHKKIRELNTHNGIKTQFFEGGSISDAYRNGVRAISASVNAFGLHDFTKLTFQGGDLVNFFTSPSSTVRLFTRNLVHAAGRFRQNSNGGWLTDERRKSETVDPAVGSMPDRRLPNPIADDIVIGAMKKTLEDYQTNDFKTEKMGVLLAAVDYDGEGKAGGRGSRAGQRGIKKGKAAIGSFQPVNIDKVRTIGFSEAWQHAGIMPSWIGSQRLEEHLARAIGEKVHDLLGEERLTPEESSFLADFGDVKPDVKTLKPKQIHLLYERSPTFRDAQDRAGFALAMTDPEALGWLEKRMKSLSSKYKDSPVSSVIAEGTKYLGQINDTYRAAARLAFPALSKGKIVSSDNDRRVIRSQITESLDSLTADIQRKTQYRDFLLYMKKGILESQDVPLSDQERECLEHDRGLLHNAGDTVMHGRFLAADDPKYGEHKTRSTANPKMVRS